MAANPYSFDQLKQLWLSAGGSPTYADMAAAVALAESGGRPDATNQSNSDGSVDRGLWQINSIHGAQSTYDPVANARAAVAISSGGTNWRPWCVTYANGSCSGSFMGAGAPFYQYLPGGSATGTTPTGSNTNAYVTSNPGGPAGAFAQFLASVLGGFGVDAAEALGAKVAKAFAKWLYHTALVVGGFTAMFLGVILLILSTRAAKAVGGVLGLGGKAYAQGRLSAKGAIAEQRKQGLLGGGPDLGSPPPAPEPRPVPRAEPLFEVGPADRHRPALNRAEDDVRWSLVKPKPARKPARRKAQVDYLPKHAAPEDGVL